MADEHDPLGFMGEEEEAPANPSTPVVAPEAPANEPAAEPEAPAGETPPEAPVEKPEPGHVPLSALLDERDRRQKAEQQLADAAANAAPVEVPDRETDPEGHEAYVQEQNGLALINQTLNFSEKWARKEHGTELVDAAKSWAIAKFDTDPAFASRVLLDADPYEIAIAEYQQEQLLTKVKDIPATELDEFLAWKAAKAKGEDPPEPAASAQSQPAAAAQAAAPAPAKIPRSIASEAGAGGARDKTPAPRIGEGVAFEDIFGGQ